MLAVILSVAITGVIVALITWLITSKSIEKSNKVTIGNAKDKAEEIVETAKKEAENLKKEAEIEAKESALQLKNELESEYKERRSELTQYEKRIIAKEETLDKRYDVLKGEEQLIENKKKETDDLYAEAENIKIQQEKELENIGGLTKEEARTYILERVEKDATEDAAKLVKAIQKNAADDAEKRVKDIIVNAISRCDIDHVSEAMISVVELPNEEMKGRIIGREGRNIRTFEKMTGVELIVDDTPEAVVLSCFNPIRREIARITLEKLIVDGRIHPTRIEEMLEKSTKELDEKIKSIGEATLIDLGIHGVHPAIVKLIGRLQYRYSFGQNALKHSVEVAILSGLLAAEVGEDVALARKAGLLHDIGKALDFEMEGTHVQLGAEICRKYKESPVVINSIESHHGDVEPDNMISLLVECADMISAARPGARREDIDVYINRLKRLEEISNAHEEVVESYAVQAGREIRVMVSPEKIDDARMELLAKDIADQIETELAYPGQIRVSVIRESRVVEYAK